MMRELWLWNRGGYYCILMGPDGRLGIPAGGEAYLRFARYAPDDIVAQIIIALENLKAGRATQVSDHG